MPNGSGALLLLLGFFFSDFDLTFAGLNVNENSRNLARTSSSAKMYGLIREANNPIKVAHSISQTLKKDFASMFNAALGLLPKLLHIKYFCEC